MVAASTKKNSDTFQIYFGNSPTSTPPPPPLPTPLYQGVNPVREVESRALTYGFASVGCMLCQ